jgi:hypothetical protein
MSMGGHTKVISSFDRMGIGCEAWAMKMLNSKSMMEADCSLALSRIGTRI